MIECATIRAGSRRPTGGAARRTRPPGQPAPQRLRASALVVLLLCISVVLVTAYLVRAAANTWVTGNVGANLEAVGRLKAADVGRWIEQRSRNLQTTLGAPLFAGTLDEWLEADHPDDVRRRRLLAHLSALAQTYGATVADLYAADARAVLLSGTGTRPTPDDAELAAQAARENHIVFEDVHFDAGEQISVGFFIPIVPESAHAPLAVVHLEFDPRVTFYPWLGSWPGSGDTAETLLARREGNEVVFLTPLRHSTVSPLRLSLSASLPAAQGLSGRSGLLSGTDYRGKPVLAYTTPVAGTPWIIVSKIDEAEAYGRARTLALLTSVAVGLFLAGAWWWWARRERETAARYADRLARATLARRIDDLGRRANDCILLYDEQLRLIEANDRALTTYGYSRDELLGKSINDLRAPQAQADLDELREALAHAPRGLIYETSHRRKDGSLFPVEASVCLIDAGDTRLCQAVIRDVSERKRVEAERAQQARRVAELSRKLMAVQEAERRELALELHDVVSPNLAAIQINLQLAAAELGDAVDENTQVRLEDSAALLQETARSLRAICANLRPPALDYGGLPAALDSYADQLGGRLSLNVRMSGPRAGWQQQSPEVESLLFRIAQEAITNAAKHAGASTIEVSLEQDGKRTVLTVADDGGGFDPELLGCADSQPGLGLLTMRERAECAGGGLRISSAPGKGTRLEVEIPRAEPFAAELPALVQPAPGTAGAPREASRPGVEDPLQSCAPARPVPDDLRPPACSATTAATRVRACPFAGSSR